MLLSPKHIKRQNKKRRQNELSRRSNMVPVRSNVDSTRSSNISMEKGDYQMNDYLEPQELHQRMKYVVGNNNEDFGDRYEEVFYSLTEAQVHASFVKIEMLAAQFYKFKGDTEDFNELKKDIDRAIYVRRLENDE